MSENAITYMSDVGSIPTDAVMQVFSCAAWTKNRVRADVADMLAGTQFAVLALCNSEPVGFARVVSDCVFRAFVEDVIVVPALRGSGVGNTMMEILEEKVRAQGVPRLEITTTQIGFWEKRGYGYKPSVSYMVKNFEQPRR